MVGGLRRLRVRGGRWLDDRFLRDLKEGVLEPLTEAVLSDTSLCLELRGAYINVYYRGGNLMKVNQRSDRYDVFFNEKYFGDEKRRALPDSRITGKAGINDWIDFYPVLKQAMDRKFSRRRKHEREFQQVVLRENNFGRHGKQAGAQSVAKSTDYFICDIEYANESGRFDLIAVHWPSTKRSETCDRRLVFIEMKYGDEALKDRAGLHAHVDDVNGYLGHPDNITRLKEEMVRVFNQKLSLGLIHCENDLGGFSDERPMLLLVLANHNPVSGRLRDVLDPPPESPHADLCIATASFLGYGLYEQGVHSVEDTFRRFDDYL